MTLPIVTIIGKPRSGKTTLIEKLIVELKRRGWRVATVKHHAHAGFDIDLPGKDSYRFGQAGSDVVVIASPDKIASYRRLEAELDLDAILEGIEGVDVVLAEGYRRAQKASIEVVRAESGIEETAGRAPNVFAVATDQPLNVAPPQFSLEAAAELVDLIEAKFLKAG